MDYLFYNLPGNIQNQIYKYLPRHPVAKCFEDWFSERCENYYEQSMCGSFETNENILWLRVRDNHEEIDGYNSFDIDYVIRHGNAASIASSW